MPVNDEVDAKSLTRRQDEVDSTQDTRRRVHRKIDPHKTNRSRTQPTADNMKNPIITQALSIRSVDEIEPGGSQTLPSAVRRELPTLTEQLEKAGGARDSTHIESVRRPLSHKMSLDAIIFKRWSSRPVHCPPDGCHRS